MKSCGQPALFENARYHTPVEVGGHRMCKFDHDFVGRTALEAEFAHPKRTVVALRGNPEGVIDICASLLRPGEEYKTLAEPRQRAQCCNSDSACMRVQHELLRQALGGLAVHGLSHIAQLREEFRLTQQFILLDRVPRRSGVFSMHQRIKSELSRIVHDLKHHLVPLRDLATCQPVGKFADVPLDLCLERGVPEDRILIDYAFNVR